jgi:cell division protein FtsQ
MKQFNWKKRIVQTLWLLAGVGTIVLFGAAMEKKKNKICVDVKIEIANPDDQMFIDEKDIMDVINLNGNITQKNISSVNLRILETALEKNPWVKNAEMFFDNNQVLHIDIEERKPIARIFSVGGNSFYVDSNGLRLPLSDKLSARVPVFTGFPSDRQILSDPDSLMLQQVVQLGKFIVADSFWMAQIAQIDITHKATFEIIPTIGDQTIAIGNADDLENKFNRLYTFYKQAWVQNGINTYERLDVQFENQVVAVKKGIAKAWVDSAKAKQVINELMSVGKDSITAAMKDSMKVMKPSAIKNVIDTKQNKVSNKSLSFGQVGQTVKTKKPLAQKAAPKAVMKKAQ